MKKITLGIAAVEQSEWPPYGKQRYFFEEMVNSTRDLTVDYFFFSPFDFDNFQDEISGWVYDGVIWKKSKQNIPECIYDRAFCASTEGKARLIAFRSKMKEANVKVLNPVDFANLLDDKKEFHQYLSDNQIPTLETFETDLFYDSDLFNNYKSLYLKPVQGSGGIGIYVLEKDRNSILLVNNTNTETLHFKSQKDLLEYLTFKINLNAYFLQKKAEVVKLENAPTDLRILIQNQGFKNYQITGKALRLGQSNSMVSNLQSGGIAIPYEDKLDLISKKLQTSKKNLTEKINEIAINCCEKLHSHFGNFFETGLDILLTKDQGPIILEANTRPSRWVFTMIADSNITKRKIYQEIRKKSVRMPAIYVINNYLK